VGSILATDSREKNLSERKRGKRERKKIEEKERGKRERKKREEKERGKREKEREKEKKIYYIISSVKSLCCNPLLYCLCVFVCQHG
jgi:hypothetical protein